MTLSKSMMRFISQHLTPFKGWIVAQLIISVIVALDTNIRPFILKIMMDKIPYLKPHEALSYLVVPACLYMGVSLIFTIANRLNDWTWLKVAPPLRKKLTDDLMRRTLGHSASFFQEHSSGALGNRMRDAANGVPDLLRIVNSRFFSYLILLFVSCFFFSRIDYKFPFLLFIFVIIFTSGVLMFSRYIRVLGHEAAEKRSYVMGRIVDVLANHLTVRLFGAFSAEVRGLGHILQQQVEADQRRDRGVLAMFIFQNMAFFTYQSICMVWLVQGFCRGQLSPGDFILVLNVNVSFLHSLWMFSEDMGRASDLLGQISQGLKLALLPVDIQDHPDAGTLVVTQGRIVFDRVKFHYRDTDVLFSDKSVTIEPGQKVGLVGYSGSGKSTFVNLILRLYEVADGRIMIDGQDIQKVSQDSLRAAIGMIPQDPVLFCRSVMDNIRYGNEEAQEKEVIYAAERAHANGFIERLPQGYHTMVGERGLRLSGGQRQRVAIARAFLKDAPILILDEATSQLDSVTEALIQETLWELMQGKTTLVIAHRLTTLLRMDRILVFDRGSIIEDGSHAELLARGGLYATLWKAQDGGLLPHRREGAR